MTSSQRALFLCGARAGLDLLQARALEPAAELLAAASQLALRRLSGLAASSAAPLLSADAAECGTALADIQQVVKKCKAHVGALREAGLPERAAAAAAGYAGQLLQVRFLQLGS